jgi:hypothetical protein
MKPLALSFCFLVIMADPAYPCGDEWETRTEEMQAQFDASIEAECRYIKCRELDEGR